MLVFSRELLEKGLQVQPFRDLPLPAHHPQHHAEVEVVHEGVEVDEVLVAGTLTGEQTVGLRRERRGERGKVMNLKCLPLNGK